MRARDISDALNYLDDDLIAEAAKLDVRKKRAVVKPIVWGAVAVAAVALVVGVISLGQAGSTQSTMKSPFMNRDSDGVANQGGEMYAAEDAGEAEDVMEAIDGDSYCLNRDVNSSNTATYAVDPGAVLGEEGMEAWETSWATVTVSDEDESDVEEPYVFVYDGRAYETYYEEAPDEIIGAVLGNAETGEEIRIDAVDPDNVIIIIEDRAYVAVPVDWED